MTVTARDATLSARLRQGDLMSAECPSREVLKHVTSRWGVLILIALEGETIRFSALRRRVGGVSERMLAQTLKWLEGDGLIERIEHDIIPPHVDYRLTPLGREAAEKVRLLADWIEVSLPRIAAHWDKVEDAAAVGADGGAAVGANDTATVGAKVGAGA